VKAFTTELFAPAYIQIAGCPQEAGIIKQEPIRTEVVMEDVKKAQPQQKEDAAKGNEALSETELEQVKGGTKVYSDFNPQPEPPGRHLPG
jgi:hypothetical protein